MIAIEPEFLSKHVEAFVSQISQRELIRSLLKSN